MNAKETLISMMAEAYRSRTYLRPLDRTPDLKPDDSDDFFNKLAFSLLDG